MGSSSLVFVGIIGLWAAYLVPQWTRRRGQLAAARQADRFSAAARVLARRPVAVRPPAEDPPGRPVRAAGPDRPLPSRSAGPVHRSTAPVHRASGPAGRASATRPPGAGRSRTSASRPLRAPATTSGPASPGVVRRDARATPSARRRAGAARRRAAVLLVLLTVAVAGWASVVSPLVPWPVAVPGTLLLLLDVAALRRAARPRRPAAPARPVGTRQPRESGAAGARSATATGAADGPPAPAAAVSPAGGAATADLVIDLRDAVVDVPSAAAAGPDADGRWSPVPVPPPTYTLKARAPYVPVHAYVAEPAGEAAAPVAGAGSPVPAEATGACVPGVDVARQAVRAQTGADPAGRAAPVREERLRAVNE